MEHAVTAAWWATVRPRLTPTRIAAAAPFLLYPLALLTRGQLRWEHAAVLAVTPVLAFGGPRWERLFFGVYPLGLVGLLYETMRAVKNVGVTPERVHVCDLHELDRNLFGGTNGISPSDWLQAHATPTMDVLCAIPYGTFLFVSVAFAIFAFRRDPDAMRRFGWAFFAVNVIGFLTYHLLPAAPPWYYHAHGCAVDVLASASEGPNLARVDALLGIGYFRSMYGRSSDVFGAMPSLHVAYPLLIVVEGYRLFSPVWRGLSLLFCVSMCFAAVYLDHHWVVDVVAGLTCAAAVDIGVRWALSGSRTSPRPTAQESAA